MIITDVEDKKAKKLLKAAQSVGAISGKETVERIYCLNFLPQNSNFLIATDNSIVYAYGKGGMIYKSAIYPYDSITTAVQEGFGAVKLIIGAGESVLLEIPVGKDEVISLMEFIRSKIGNANSPQSPNASVVDEIKKYKELLDLGAITQEEYDKKKSHLLGL